MIKVINDIQEVISRSNTAIVLMFDLSAAFDTVDHKLLLNKLNMEFKIGGNVLQWLQS